jgi:hypothetical protein
MARYEKVLQGGAGAAVEFTGVKHENYKLGLCFRSLVGLNREAAKRAFPKFLLEAAAQPGTSH